MSPTSPQDSANPPAKYAIGINNDDGDCHDVVIKQNDRPIATLIASEAEIRPLVHAANCHATLLSALRAAEAAIDEAAGIMLYEEGLPVTFLEAREIELAYGTLVSVLFQVHEAIGAGGAP